MVRYTELKFKIIELTFNANMTNVEKKILTFLRERPEQELYAQEIVAAVRCSKASASNILAAFSAKKMTLVRTRGHMKFYHINSKHPDVKIFALQQAMKAVKPISEKLKRKSTKIILFGSASRGEQTTSSDLDILVVTTEKTAVRNILNGNTTRLPVNAILKTPSEWSEMEVREPELYHEIKSGITLHDYVSRI